MGLSLPQFWRAFGISGGGFEHPNPPRYATAYIFYVGFPLCLVPSIIALDEEKSLLQGLETYTLGFKPLS